MQVGLFVTLLSLCPAAAQPSSGPVSYEITPVLSKITFHVKASIPIEGTFEKWNAKMVFASTAPSSGSLEFTIQADSVHTGSTAKDERLKGESCFDAKNHPYITFRSTKIVEKSPHKYEVLGTVTIRGVSKTEMLTFIADRKSEGKGEIEGKLWFDRRRYGLGGSIPFVKIADAVELTIDFKAKRISGPPLLFK